MASTDGQSLTCQNADIFFVAPHPHPLIINYQSLKHRTRKWYWKYGFVFEVLPNDQPIYMTACSSEVAILSANIIA